MTKQYTTNDQEYKLLELIAGPEEHKGAPDPYMSVFNGYYEPLPSLTIAQAQDYQVRRYQEKKKPYEAIGRYQFIIETLARIVRDLDPSTIFNKVTQDYLAIVLMKPAGLRRWQSGEISSTQFHVGLCKVWAGIPLPVATNGKAAGQSYYHSNINRAYGDPGAYLRKIEQLRIDGPGQEYTLTLGVSSRPYAPTGSSSFAQANITAGGGQNYQNGAPYTAAAQRGAQSGSGGYGASVSNISSSYQGILPAAENPYLYELIHPLDNRYDFRTGRKVRDLLINGINPASATGLTSGNGLPPTDGFGSPGFTDDERNQLTKGPDDGTRDGTPTDGTYTKSVTVSTPSGPQTVTKRYKKIDTPGGIQEVEVKEPKPVTGTSYVSEITTDSSGNRVLKKLPTGSTQARGEPKSDVREEREGTPGDPGNEPIREPIPDDADFDAPTTQKIASVPEATETDIETLPATYSIKTVNGSAVGIQQSVGGTQKFLGYYTEGSAFLDSFVIGKVDEETQEVTVNTTTDPQPKEIKLLKVGL